MSLSDCEKCWETPCCCGYDYLFWKKEKIKKHIELLSTVLSVKSDSRFSNTSEQLSEVYRRMGD